MEKLLLLSISSKERQESRSQHTLASSNVIIHFMKGNSKNFSIYYEQVPRLIIFTIELKMFESIRLVLIIFSLTYSFYRGRGGAVAQRVGCNSTIVGLITNG